MGFKKITYERIGPLRAKKPTTQHGTLAGSTHTHGDLKNLSGGYPAMTMCRKRVDKLMENGHQVDIEVQSLFSFDLPPGTFRRR